MRTCMPRAAQISPCGSRQKKQTGQREKLVCDAVSTEALANLGKLGSLQTCPESEQGLWIFIRLQAAGMPLGQAALFS